MFFTVNSDYNSIPILKSAARRYLILCKKRTTEKILERYLIQKYKIGLVQACLQILNIAKYNFDSDNNIIVTIPNKRLEEIAAVITYGTGKIVGSSILRRAIEQR